MKSYPSAPSLFASFALAAALGIAPAPAGAAQTDISTVPMGTASATTVLPNLMFVLDDSGSMSLHILPDNVNANNTCKSYVSNSGGATSTNCLLPTTTNTVSPTTDTVRFVDSTATTGNGGTARWLTGPPAMAAEFNTVYYNPQITYNPGLNASGVSLGNQNSALTAGWTKVMVNPYVSANTFDLTTLFPEPVFCTKSNSVETDNNECRRNGYDGNNPPTLLASFRYSSASTPGNGTFGWPEQTGGGNPSFVRMRFGAPHYYTIQPREWCSDTNLTLCSTTQGGANVIPAPVRYCTTSLFANQTAFVSGGSPASCQAKLDGSHTFMRYGTFVRADIVPSVATYGGRPNRNDCAAKPVCTYAEEMTNFANWFAYYQTRMKTMKSAAGRVFAPLDDRYRIGFVTINAAGSAKYLKIDKFSSTHKSDWYTKFYAQTPNGSTPLREALSRVGRHYGGVKTGINSFMPDDPVQYSCQQNFTLLTTDGYWNGNAGQTLTGGAIGNQDNVVETFVNRPTVTLDGEGTTVADSTSTRTLEQVVCTANAAGSANFSGVPDTNCGCSASFKRVKQRTLDTITTTTSVDGVAGAPSTSTVSTFQDITACDATVSTTTWLVTEREDRQCTGTANTAFSAGSASNAGGQTACGCTGSNRRNWRRTLTYDRTQQTIDGAVQSSVNGSILTQAFTALTGCTNPAAPSTTPVITLGPPSTPPPTGATITSANFTISPNPKVTTLPPSSSTTPGGFADTLADVAMYYYKTDLRPTGAVSKNNVPTTAKDTAAHQHMVTFTLGLGLDGLMNYQSDYETATTGDFNAIRTSVTNCSFTGTGTCNWPQPVQDQPSALDDLWHAAVNGRGIYFSAKNPNSLQSGLTTALAAIKITTGAASAAATSQANITPTDNFEYSSTYRTVKWDGEVVAAKIDVVTGSLIPGNIWSVNALLDPRALPASDNRSIFTFDPSDLSDKLKPFLYGNLTLTEQAFFNNHCTTSPAVWPQCGPMLPVDLAIANSGTNLVNYLRGQKQHETNYYRIREHTLGDTVNAKPAFLGKPNLLYGDAVVPDYNSFKSGPAASRPPVVFIAANDGMLHAFNAGEAAAGGGTELWAYVPRMVMPELYKLAAVNYDVNHRYFVDGSPATMDVFLGGAWKTMLVGGLNAGGRGFFALDVTDTGNPKGLWEICSDASLCAISDPDLGYSFGQPIITKRPSDGKWVVIVTSGYNNVTPGDGGGYLFVLDAATGAVLSKTPTTISGTNVGDTTTPSGFAKIAGFAINFAVNNTTTIVYGGDLLGNVWRFDLSTDAAFPNVVTVQRIGQALDGSSPAKPQSITSRPEITRFDAGFNVIYVGTGRLLGSSDLQDPATLTPPLNLAYQQSVYGLKDTGADVGNMRAPAAKLVQQVMSLIDATNRTISNNGVDWTTQNGWWVDFNPAGDSPGERVVNDQFQLVRGVLLLQTNEPNNEACSSGGNRFDYQFDYRSGSYLAASPGAVVGFKSGAALSAGFVVYRLPSGQLKYTSTDVTGQKSTGGVLPGASGSLGRRATWRELYQ
ncbi:MAG: PilC/PilY family type IV pilus protein [Burkholderiales bacterium]